MTYNDIFNRRNILANIPLALDGNRLPKQTAASVMLLRVAYQNKVDEFVKFIQDVQRGLKKEGFDERAQSVAEMKGIDERRRKAEEWDGEGEQPAMPSKEELEKADKTRETLDDFEAERRELEDATLEAQRKKAEEKVDMKNGTLTRQELADIYDLLGAEGDIAYSVPGMSEPTTVPREWLLGLIASNLVA